MRSTVLILLLTISLAAAAPAVAKQEAVRVELGKSVTADRGRIRIKFQEELEDSRCPVDATCVWAGNAKIRISVSKGKSAPQVIELNTLSEPSKQMLYGYEFSIKELYPRKGEARPMKPAAVLLVLRQ